MHRIKVVSEHLNRGISTEFVVQKMPAIGDEIRLRAPSGWYNLYVLAIDLSDSTGLPLFKTVAVPVYGDSPVDPSHDATNENNLHVHWVTLDPTFTAICPTPAKPLPPAPHKLPAHNFLFMY